MSGTFQWAAFMRTTLPFDAGQAVNFDDGRYHSIWMPDHIVSFWPDAIWTPEFTDLATVSPSPHRYLETMSAAGAVAALTSRARIVTTVTDTVRRYPVMLAQAALTLGHLSRGRFILGIGSGEHENAVPYGIAFDRPVGRFEEALTAIRLLWETDGPVNFDGRFFKLENARLDTEPYAGAFPPIWVGSAGPRMLELTGRFGDGWLAAGSPNPDEYARNLATIRAAAQRAGRDPQRIVAAGFIGCLLGEPEEIDEILRAPLVKSYIFQASAETLRRHGYAHPCGEHWRGYIDLDPHHLTRERVLEAFSMATPELLRKIIVTGTPKEIARYAKGFVDAGMQVGCLLDYSGMGGLKFAATSAAKHRQAEDELLRLVGAN
ncbi:MAG: LLM class flavin-dependent oxidoreductase [Gammaproteobacteria bacterium]